MLGLSHEGDGFAALTARLLPGSRIEVLCADVDPAEIERMLPQLDGWAIERLRVVSPRLEKPLELVGSPGSPSVAVVDPEILTAPSTMTLTVWRWIPVTERRFVRSFDLSAVGELPRGHGCWNSFFLESVTLPVRLRALPSLFFARCPRLSHVGTAGCMVLEEIGWDAFGGCRRLREFVFPSIVRTVNDPFGGTSITCLDLSGTRAESVAVRDMKFLERLVLPRRCVLKRVCGLPALRTVTFGARPGYIDVRSDFGGNPREVRFESLAAPAKGGPLWTGTCAFAEVACVLGRDSFPFPS
jgi:hypothetical protein